MAYYVKGELEKALADYNMANELDSEAVRSYVSEETFYKDVGKLDELLANYIEAVTILSKYKDKNKKTGYDNVGYRN